jgi:hypothetical protein
MVAAASMATLDTLAMAVPRREPRLPACIPPPQEREGRRAALRAADACACAGAGDAAVAAGPEAQAGTCSSAAAAPTQPLPKPLPQGPGGGGGKEDPPVVPRVPFAACLAAWAAEEALSDVWSVAAGAKVAACRRTRFATFPPYLLIAMKCAVQRAGGPAGRHGTCVLAPLPC